MKLHSYIKGESMKEELKSFFNEKEIKHLEDVKVLFNYGFNLKKAILYPILTWNNNFSYL